MNWDPDAYGGYLDPAPGYQYEDGPIAESNFGFALSNSTAEFVFDQLYTYENNDEDLGATFEWHTYIVTTSRRAALCTYPARPKPHRVRPGRPQRPTRGRHAQPSLAA